MNDKKISDRVYDLERRPLNIRIIHIVINILLIAALALLVIWITGGKGNMDIPGLFGKKERTAGRDFPLSDITEFYYTLSSSTDPPHYQRYRFYTEDGKHMFYHETREGGGWPQTEKDITASGTVTLTDDQWQQFLHLVEEGTVKAREESLDDGDEGPWLYLYWKNDRSKYQEYSFPSYGARLDFEEFCEALAD